MVEFILEFIAEFVWKLILGNLGASFRWIFLRKMKTFKQISDDVVINGLIGFVFIAAIILYFTYPLSQI